MMGFGTRVPDSPSFLDQSFHQPFPWEPGNLDIDAMIRMNDDSFERQRPAPFAAPIFSTTSPRLDAPPSAAEESFHSSLGYDAQTMQQDTNSSWPHSWQNPHILTPEVVDDELDLLQGQSHLEAHASMYAQGTLQGSDRVPPSQKIQYRQADEIEFTERLELMKAKYGPNHPATLDTSSRLASIFEAQGRYRSAEKLHREVARAWQSTLGADNPSTLPAFSDLCKVFLLQGRYVEAKRISNLLYDKATEVMHASSPSLLSIKYTLAQALRMCGNYVDGEIVYREIIRTGGAMFTPDHPLILAAMTDLASSLKCRAEYAEAEKIVTVIYEATCMRYTSRDVLALRSLLGEIVCRKADDDRGRVILEELIAAQTRTIGPEHADTLYSQGRLAYALGAMCKYHESEDLWRDVLEKGIRVLGRRHPITIYSDINLGSVLAAQRDR